MKWVTCQSICRDYMIAWTSLLNFISLAIICCYFLFLGSIVGAREAKITLCVPHARMILNGVAIGFPLPFLCIFNFRIECIIEEHKLSSLFLFFQPLIIYIYNKHIFFLRKFLLLDPNYLLRLSSYLMARRAFVGIVIHTCLTLSSQKSSITSENCSLSSLSPTSHSWWPENYYIIPLS
jgi:hypothetical protein